jgi:hypothetical protein
MFDAQRADANLCHRASARCLWLCFRGCRQHCPGRAQLPITHLPAPAQLHPRVMLPVVVAPHTLGLDEADTRFAIAGSGSRKNHPSSWRRSCSMPARTTSGRMACNGKTLRLLRDAATLTRPAFSKLTWQDLLSGQRYAEFANVWRLLHASRAAGGAGRMHLGKVARSRAGRGHPRARWSAPGRDRCLADFG